MLNQITVLGARGLFAVAVDCESTQGISSGSAYIVPFIGIISVCLAAIFASAGYFFKLRAERLKNRRNILYFLLEFRHGLVVRSVGPEEYFRQYLEYVKGYFSSRVPPIRAEFNPEDIDLAINALKISIEGKFDDLGVELVESFTKCLSELAKEDPLLAWQLKGSEIIEKVLKVNNEFLERLSATNMWMADIKASQMATELVRNRLASSVAEEIDEKIRSVSWSCGMITYFRCRRILSTKKSDRIDFSGLGIDSLLDEMYVNLSGAGG